MTSNPPWLTKTTPTLDRVSGVVFMPVQLKTNGHQQFAIDAESAIYPVEQLEAATPESFEIERVFISDRGFRFTVQRCTEGLLLNGRLRVRLDDAVDIAAKKIAEYFNGAIVKDINLAQFGVAEEVDDDW